LAFGCWLLAVGCWLLAQLGTVSRKSGVKNAET